MNNSTRPDPKRNVEKPARPPGSPLFWHATGRWAKKIRGRLHYFGRGSHEDALAAYLKIKDDLHAGRLPRGEVEDAAGLTVWGLSERFITTKKQLRDAGELSPHTLLDYSAVCRLLIRAFGRGRLVADLGPADFERLRAMMAKTWGPVRVGNFINKCRVVLNYAVKNGLLEKAPIYGEGFNRPSRATLRRLRAAKGPRMYEADELRRMIDAAGPALRAMILLGINCGFGNADCGTLPLSALDLDGGWVNFHRPKTGIPRRCPLWPETVAALRLWLEARPSPASEEHAGLVFLTSRGAPWCRLGDNEVAKETAKLLRRLGIAGGRGFYGLRHTFQTIADESGDFLAVRHIMGHASNDIADSYRERISDARLRRAAATVHDWLFASVQ